MPKLKYRMKKHVGPHYKDGKKYGPGDIIELYEHQGSNLAHKVDRLDPLPPEPEPQVSMIIMEFKDGLFNIVNELTSEKINGDPLTMDQAVALVGPKVPIKMMDEKVEAPTTPEILAKHRGGGRYILTYFTGEKLFDHYFTRAEAAEAIKAVESGKLTIDELAEKYLDE